MRRLFLRLIYWFNENDAASQRKYAEALYWGRKRESLEH